MDWLDWIVPFISGAGGVGITYGAMRQSLEEHERRITKVETKLEQQVGELRCDKLRNECRDSITKGLDEIKQEIIANRNWVLDRFTEIARFMGQHNKK